VIPLAVFRSTVFGEWVVHAAGPGRSAAPLSARRITARSPRSTHQVDGFGVKRGGRPEGRRRFVRGAGGKLLDGRTHALAEDNGLDGALWLQAKAVVGARELRDLSVHNGRRAHLSLSTRDRVEKVRWNRWLLTGRAQKRSRLTGTRVMGHGRRSAAGVGGRRCQGAWERRSPSSGGLGAHVIAAERYYAAIAPGAWAWAGPGAGR